MDTLASAFRRLAERDGVGGLASSYAAGRFGLRHLPPGLEQEPIPTSEPCAEAIGERYGVPGWALWLLVEEYEEQTPT